MGVTDDGEVLATGDDRCGVGEVSGWRDVVAVSAGSLHTLALGADGSVRAAGLASPEPGALATWKDVVAVSAGATHSLGLMADGSVLAVGDDAHGQARTQAWTLGRAATGDRERLRR